MKIVSGIAGQNDIFIAMERGEVDGTRASSTARSRSTRPTWLSEQDRPRWSCQYGPEPLPELPGVAFAPDHITNATNKALFATATGANALGRRS